MRKLFLMLAVLLLASAAYAVEISCTSDLDVVTVSYTAVAEANIPRAFGLNIQLNNAETITSVTVLDPNYWVYPGSYPGDPNGPVGQVTHSSDTLPGIDTNGITIEMGSLHYPPEANSVNAPDLSNDLLSFTVSGGCEVNIVGNAARGKVVFYNATNEDDGRDVGYTGCSVSVCCPGDGDCDFDLDLDDYGGLKGKLAYADYLIGDYLVLPPEVNATTGFLWDPLYDIDQDEDLDLDDYGTLKGKLAYADYLIGDYLVLPPDVNVTTGFLWPCQ